MDVELFGEIGKEFKKRFEGEEVTKILTIVSIVKSMTGTGEIEFE